MNIRDSKDAAEATNAELIEEARKARYWRPYSWIGSDYPPEGALAIGNEMRRRFGWDRARIWEGKGGEGEP